MFFGEFEYKIDEKGRVPIPPRFRSELKAGVVLTQGMEKCITIYPLSEWKKVADELTSGAVTRSKLRRLNRAIFSSAFTIAMDRQGRIAIPMTLKLTSEIVDDVVMAGANNYLELWSKSNWADEKGLSREQAWQIMESLENHQ
jgi:MraZ protein